MNKELKEKIARNAACIWCRCFKCDGIIRDTHDECDKEKLLTCHQWYHGYRTAMIAMENYDQQIMNNAVDTEIVGIKKNVLSGSAGYVEIEGNYKEGDKIKVLIVKED